MTKLISRRFRFRSKHRHYGDSGANGFGSRSSSAFLDSGPPYIVKLSNIPVSSDDAFIEDLFRSRFTPFKKFKIVVDPSSNPLETGVVKKIAFVELCSFSDQNRVLKWQDLFYKGSRRVIIELADFNDFKYCMSFNEENAQRLHDVEHEFLSNRGRPLMNEGRNSREPMDRHPMERHDGFRRDMERHEFHRGPSLLHHGNVATPSSGNGHDTPILGASKLAPKLAPKPKPNPFGNAKPVDVIARQQEIEKKLITINHTTIKTAGSLEEPEENTRKLRSSKSTEKSLKKNAEQKSSSSTEERHATHTENSTGNDDQKRQTELKEESTPGLKPAQAPPSVYDQKQSLADILSSKSDQDGSLLPHRSNAGTPKLKAAKPVILKKKPSVVSSPAHQLELEKMSSQEIVHEEEEKTIDESKQQQSGQDIPKDTEETPEKKLNQLVVGEKNEEREKERLAKTRRRRELKSKEFSKNNETALRSDLGRSESSDKDKLTRRGLSERNTSFASEDRPNFKEHFTEMTQAAESDSRNSARSSKTRRSRGTRDRKRSTKRISDALNVQNAGDEQAGSGPSVELKDVSPKGGNIDTKLETKRNPRRPRNKQPKNAEDAPGKDISIIRGAEDKTAKVERTREESGEKTETKSGDERRKRGGRNRRGRRRKDIPGETGTENPATVSN